MMHNKLSQMIDLKKNMHAKILNASTVYIEIPPIQHKGIN